MGKVFVGAVVIAALGVAACGPAIPPVRGKGGPAWLELTSEHFTVWTSGDPGRVRQLVQKMEYLRRVIVGVMLPSAPSGRVLVIAVRDDDELAAFSRTGQPRAFAVSARPPLRQPLIVMAVHNDSDRQDRTLAHELAHAISFGIIHHQPRWLAEGMAQFFEHVDLDPEAAVADVGGMPTHHATHDVRAQLVSIANLFQWNEVSSNEEQEYLTADVLFQFLYNAHPDELMQYVQLLQRDGEASPDQEERTWKEAFPSLPFAEVDVELQRWMVSGRHAVLRVRMAPQQWSVAARGLRDADTHAIRGLLRIFAEQQVQARPEVAAALELEPDHVLAHLLRVALDNQMVSIAQSRALIGAHPDDWRAWWLHTLALEEAHGDPAEHESARARMCAMVAQNPALTPPQPSCPARDDRAPPVAQREPQRRTARRNADELPAAAMEQYHRGEQLFADGDMQGAAAALGPITRVFPAYVKARVLGCRIELARAGARDAGAIATCEQAAASASEVEPVIAIGAARLSAGDASGARETLLGAERRIERLAPDEARAAWLLLAAQYRAMGALTWAEDALARAGVRADSRDEIAVWAATSRARYGIPRDGTRWQLSPDDEAAAIAAVREAVALSNAGDFVATEKVIAAAERRWPSLPGVLTARCALDFQRDAIAAARQRCDQAIAQGGSSWALYLRGVIELGDRRGRAAVGIAKLRAAIALDPDLVQAWRALGRALGRIRAHADLAQLRLDYRARFNAPLPGE